MPAVGRVMALVAAAVLAVGCLPLSLIAPTLTTGPSLGRDAVETIRPGVTTAGEVLQTFGPPVSIVRSGEVVAIPAERVYVGVRHGFRHGIPVERGGSYEVDADTFVELFGAPAVDPKRMRIYYYRRAANAGYLFTLGLINYESARVKVERLWILVDEDAGTVKAYVYRPDE